MASRSLSEETRFFICKSNYLFCEPWFFFAFPTLMFSGLTSIINYINLGTHFWEIEWKSALTGVMNCWPRLTLPNGLRQRQWIFLFFWRELYARQHFVCSVYGKCTWNVRTPHLLTEGLIWKTSLVTVYANTRQKSENVCYGIICCKFRKFYCTRYQMLTRLGKAGLFCIL